MSVHVVITVLGVVLDDEDNGVTGETAPGDRLDDLAYGKVVGGDLGLRRGRASGVSAFDFIFGLRLSTEFAGAGQAGYHMLQTDGSFGGARPETRF